MNLKPEIEKILQENPVTHLGTHFGPAHIVLVKRKLDDETIAQAIVDTHRLIVSKDVNRFFIESWENIFEFLIHIALISESEREYYDEKEIGA